MHRVIKMHYAHQRMPCFKTEIPVISFSGVGLVDFHIKVSFCKVCKNQWKGNRRNAEYVIRALLAVILL